MVERTQDIESELRVTPRAVILIPFAVAHIILIVGDGFANTALRAQAQNLGLLLYVVSAAAWVLAGWKEHTTRWVVVGALVALVQLIAIWQREPQYLAFMAFPTAVAAVLIGSPAGVIAALVQTLLLTLQVLIMRPETGLVTGVTSLIALWSVAGAASVIYGRAIGLTRWSWGHFERAQQLLEEDRNRKAELEKALGSLEHANRQLALAGERMAGLRTVAEEARQNKMTFVTRVSHEFRTPVNIIMGIADLMLKNPELYGGHFPRKALEHLHIVHRNCEHLSSMVDDVLDLTQTEGGRMRFVREPVDLHTVIDEAADVVRPLLQEKGLGLQIDIPGDLPQVTCDRTRIRQVTLNLLSNAARFTEQGGIAICVTEKDQQVVVSVADTGPGIQPDDAERIFEPFVQAPDARERGKGGSGLGLSISKAFVELHGGRVWLESKPGVGTTFFFTLPKSTPADHIVRPGHSIREDWVWRERGFRTDGARGPAHPTRSRVVIYDETGGLRSEYERYADEIEFTDITRWQEIPGNLQDVPAHAVMLNTASLGDFQGIADQMRYAIPDTPIIGCSIPRQIHQALEAGAVDYLTKPVSIADLRRTIQAVGPPLRRILIVDDDPDARELLTMCAQTLDGAIEVVLAEDGQGALEALRDQRPDLMLLDIVMPGVDGWEVLAAKAKDNTIKAIPTIVLSGEDPRSAPTTTHAILATMGAGLSISKLMKCTHQLSKALLQPD